jgi:hypothetical protein
LAFLATVAIGVLEGATDVMFGAITDAALDSKGRLYVADGRLLDIRRFEPDSNMSARVGRPGSGPGEFKHMERIEHDRDSLLYAVDMGHRRLTVYNTLDSLTIVREIRLPLLASDLCVTRRRIFLSGVHAQNTIVEIDVDGRVRNAFAELYSGPELPSGRLRRSVQETMSEGLLACSNRSELVFHIARNRPVVSAFALSGKKVWSVELAKYSRLRVVPLENGGLAFDGDATTGGQHFAVSLAIVEPDYLLVQLVFLNANDRVADEAPVETRVLDLKTGRELGTIRSLPRIAAATGKVFSGFENVPFPRAFIGRITREELK